MVIIISYTGINILFFLRIITINYFTEDASWLPYRDVFIQNHFNDHFYDIYCYHQ